MTGAEGQRPAEVLLTVREQVDAAARDYALGYARECPAHLLTLPDASATLAVARAVLDRALRQVERGTDGDSTSSTVDPAVLREVATATHEVARHVGLIAAGLHRHATLGRAGARHGAYTAPPGADPVTEWHLTMTAFGDVERLLHDATAGLGAAAERLARLHPTGVPTDTGSP